MCHHTLLEYVILHNKRELRLQWTVVANEWVLRLEDNPDYLGEPDVIRRVLKRRR
jgi:hypothetical protein